MMEPLEASSTLKVALAAPTPSLERELAAHETSRRLRNGSIIRCSQAVQTQQAKKARRMYIAVLHYETQPSKM
ncbi:hypothetical protein LTR95_002054 [Oleoguttula sp. CCFEE 5521]